ncbi:hypothetical protein BTVI_43916 [Pitangus sulphuratus]|nr:hypothetical protein BTVI_43916 [Pitangus sulphuratus]
MIFKKPNQMTAASSQAAEEHLQLGKKLDRKSFESGSGLRFTQRWWLMVQWDDGVWDDGVWDDGTAGGKGTRSDATRQDERNQTPGKLERMFWKGLEWQDNGDKARLDGAWSNLGWWKVSLPMAGGE